MIIYAIAIALFVLGLALTIICIAVLTKRDGE